MIPLANIQVSKSKEAQFLSKGITCVEELARFFPRKYYDFRKLTPIGQAENGQLCRVSGRVISATNMDRATIVITDGTERLTLVWFNGCYFFPQMRVGSTWTFCGKITEYYGDKQMVQPMFHAEGADQLNQIYPVYSKIKGMSDDYLQKKIEASLSALPSAWSDKDSLAQALSLRGETASIQQMHRPADGDSWKAAHKRIVFDKIYDFYEELYRRKSNQTFYQGCKFLTNHALAPFIDSLPFPLTEDQEKAIRTVIEKTNTGELANLLITGDVGCGKTIVALLAVILAWENHFQSIVMAPTLVLAKQHYEEMSKTAEAIGIRFALLTGEVKTAERRKILKGLESGEIDVLIGTHAVLSSTLKFKALGLTIVDEEHRFGTKQKEILEQYCALGAHHISMTATPIPRSRAATIYGGNTDLITIETMPEGRKPVITSICKRREQAYEAILQEVKAGHQGYIVCPFIEDAENPQFANVVSTETVMKELSQYCKTHLSSVKIACVTGDMKPAEMLTVIDAFKENKVQILVGTTVVEVGVNVPNATAIAIMNAERFGLSALHQLRGRVGRKGDQGYCLLVSNVFNEKLEALTKYHNGFKIAEIDAKLRGPGDLLGNEQTGDSSIISLIDRWPKMTENIRRYFDARFTT